MNEMNVNKNEWRRKISEAMKRHFSSPAGDEHRRRMSEGMKQFWSKIKSQT